MFNIDNNFKFNNNDTIIVGCSGGPDSMALLDMLLKIREKYNLKIIVAHVNYNVREESVLEENYVRDYSESNNLIFEGLSVTEYSDDNFENEARKIRYKFFDELVSKYDAKYVMVAHHCDDLIETILMKIVRGSNINGYAGFKKILDRGNYKIVRPLIEYSKDEIIKYCSDNNIKYYIDKSNNDTFYTRNRYRKNILPLLKLENKDVHRKFLKYSNSLLETHDYISKLRDNALKRCLDDKGIDINIFKLEDEFIQKEIIYYLLDEYYQDDLFMVSDKHIDLLIKLIYSKRANVNIDLPNGVRAIKNYNYFKLDKINTNKSYELVFDEKVRLPNGKMIIKVDSTDSNSNYVCRLNSLDIKLPLIVRNRKNGDKIKVKGMNGTKKIKDIFIDRKINKEDRDILPIVTDSDNNILWVPGIIKSVFDKSKNDSYDIILKYMGGENEK